MNKAVFLLTEPPLRREEDTQFTRNSMRSSHLGRRNRRSDRRREFNHGYEGPYRRHIVDRRENLKPRRNSDD